MHKMIVDKKLVDLEQRDTIIAERLNAPITIGDLANDDGADMFREDYFYDPLLAGDKPNQDGGNYNKSEDRAAYKKKKDIKYEAN